MSEVHPIEAESMRILSARTDLSHLAPGPRAVVSRIVHATADLELASDVVCSEEAVAAGLAALAGGAPVVPDVAKVAAGLTGGRAPTWIDDPRVPDLAAAAGVTRSAAAVRLAVEETGPGAVHVIGCAPTALAELLTLDAAPAFVVGLPVGFVGAVDAKAALRASGLPAISNRGEKGGSAAAVAALNALLRLSREGTGVAPRTTSS